MAEMEVASSVLDDSKRSPIEIGGLLERVIGNITYGIVFGRLTITILNFITKTCLYNLNL